MDILVLTIAPRGILGEEKPEPFDGGGFRGPSITIFHTGEVISNKDPSSFTIETLIVLALVSRISRGLAREGEVNGQALMRDSRSTDGLMTWRCFCLLCLDTGRASRHHSGFPFEFWNTSNGLVSSIQISVTRMA